MCQYLVFFIISLSFGLDKRLLQDPATVEGERRDLSMFGQYQPRRHYEDYFAGGHRHAMRHNRHQVAVAGDKDIKVDELTGHYPFDKEDGDNWESILEKSKAEADAMAAKAKQADDAEMKQQDDKEKEDKKKEGDEEKAKEDKEKKEKGPDDSEGGGKDSSSDSKPTKQVPKYLVKMNGEAPPQQPPDKVSNTGNPEASGAKPNAPAGGANPNTPGKHGLTENQNYVPDTVPQKKACEFTPGNCYCGARPTQQMDLLCASKKREYCGWFCKHKMGGREGKPKTGPDQFAGEAPKPLKPEKRASPNGCPNPSLQVCESIYSDPNSPDYVGDGYAPPGANCVCHIDQKTGHAVITDLPNSAALPGANKPAAAGAPAATQPAAGAATGPATSGAPAEAANSNGAGPDSGNAANPAAAAITGAANDAVQGIQAAQQTANAAGEAAAQTAQAATDAAGKVEEESKGMWHHAKGLASAAGGGIKDAASSVWNGAKNLGSKIFGDEAEAEVQGGYPGPYEEGDTEFSMSGGPAREDHPTLGETSVSNGIDEVFEDDEVALGMPGDWGVH